MAYKAKYYYQVERGGDIFVLVISEDTDAEVTPKYLGTVQALSLEYDGGSNDLENAIMKTSLHLSLADAEDIAPTVKSCIYGDFEAKNGGWEEFYTPDSDKYKFEIREVGHNATKLIWAGYLTPDSWEEDLTYHGSIHLTARDNIGHLEDFEFDYTTNSGMADVGAIITAALEKINFAMTLNLDYGDLVFEGEDGSETNLSNVYVALETFKDDTWYKALGDILDSLGLVLRYTRGYNYSVTTLRQWSSAGRATVPILFGGDGHRSLSPAYKMIREEFEPKKTEDYLREYTKEDYMRLVSSEYKNAYAPTDTSPWRAVGTFPMIDPFNLSSDSFRAPGETSIFVMDRHTIAEDHVNFISRRLSDSSEAGVIKLKITMNNRTLKNDQTTLGKLTIREFDGDWTNTTEMGDKDEFTNWVVAKTLDYAIAANTANQGTLWLNSAGKWVSSYQRLKFTVGNFDYITKMKLISDTLEKEIEIPADSTVDLYIYGVAFWPYINSTIPGGSWYPPELQISRPGDTLLAGEGSLFTEISEISVDIEGEQVPRRIIKTIYDEKNNVTLERRPNLGEVDWNIVNRRSAINSFYLLSSAGLYSPIRRWKWKSTQMSWRSLPTLIHQEILTFHSKPNNILSGTILMDGKDSPGINESYVYGGKTHLLCGGSWNIISGTIDSGVVREYVPYTSIWNDEYKALVYVTNKGSVATLRIVSTIKQYTGLSLPQAKAIADSLPGLVYEFNTLAEANPLITALGNLGCSVRVDRV